MVREAGAAVTGALFAAVGVPVACTIVAGGVAAAETLGDGVAPLEQPASARTTTASNAARRDFMRGSP
jgi:hypothetical protein